MRGASKSSMNVYSGELSWMVLYLRLVLALGGHGLHQHVLLVLHGFYLLVQLGKALAILGKALVLRTQAIVYVLHVARDAPKTSTVRRHHAEGHPATATPTGEYVDIGQHIRWQLAARVHAVVVARCRRRGLRAFAHIVCTVHTAEERVSVSNQQMTGGIFFRVPGFAKPGTSRNGFAKPGSAVRAY